MLDKLPYYHIVIPDMLIFLVTIIARERARAVYLGSIGALIAISLFWAAYEPSTVGYTIFFAITFLSFAFALEFGGKSEREATLMGFILMVIPYFAAFYQPGTMREFDPIGAVADVAYMVWLGVIAHRYDRFWAYFASACFALAVVGHVAVFISADFLPRAYFQMRFVPSGMFVFLLVLAAAMNVRRNRKIRLLPEIPDQTGLSGV